ncbi:MAG TPA: GreA/GreB family elongation factor [bacterium]|nr:GreA/GreB family elongation factor [bacterium]HPT29684.1 GreA/GreB family elongation factor [bacterium]
MRVPTRKSSLKNPYTKPDPNLTWDKFNELKNKLEKLKKVSRPREAEEVKRLALMGDFSENAGYQLAKSRLRGINQRITDLENLLTRAEIISFGGSSGQVDLGNLITLVSGNIEKKYRILGSAETNPGSGVISHNSPLGAALMRHAVGDTITVEIGGRKKEYKITNIE